jgi:hypothetical protein
VKRLEQRDSCEDIVLLTCVLFICVEFLQGNEAEALALCAKGMKSTAKCAEHGVQRKRNISTVIEDIDPIFTRLGILSSLFGQPIETVRPALVK